MRFNSTEFLTLLFAIAKVYGKSYECSKHVVVQEGEDCYNYDGITQSIDHIRINDLLTFNPTLDCDNLVVGTKVCLEADLDKYSETFNTYTIEENDTLQSLSEKLNTSIEILRRLNKSIFSAYGDDETLDGIVDVEIDYRKDGDYTPNFDNSEDVTVKSSNTVENGKEYQCDKHVVVPEGGQCSDYIRKNDIPYVRMKDLTAYNPSVDCDNLVAGTKLCLLPGDDFDITSEYGMNGTYVPKFDNSEDVTVKSSNTAENGKEYQCDKHVVVPEGGQCSDYIRKNDIPYVRMKDLTAYNPSVDCDNLVAGTKLCLLPGDDFDITSEYGMNGTYVPKFDNSEDVTVNSSNAVENGKEYQCDKHVVVPEGGQCSDYIRKNDIPYVRMKDLTAYNPSIDCDNLVAGTKLCLLPGDDFDITSEYGMNGTYVPKFDNSEDVTVNSSNAVENGKEYQCDKHVVVPEGGQCSDYIRKNDIPYVRMKDLTSYNPSVDCDNLVAGTKLCLLPGEDFDITSEYGMNGTYVPKFDNSEDVSTTKSSNSAESLDVYDVETTNGFECSKHVVVQEGEDCYDYDGYNQSIGHVRINDLFTFNPALDCDNLVVGTKVCLDTDIDNFSNSFNHYTIEKNDTLQSISEKLNTPIKIIKHLNRSIYYAIKDDETLDGMVGVEIDYREDGNYVPNFDNSEELTTTITKSSNSDEGSSGYECSKHVVVHEGETCYDYNGYKQSIDHIRINDLLYYNPTLDCDNLVVGTKVCLDDDIDKLSNIIRHYTIEENDTLQSLSEKLNISIKILRHLNSSMFYAYGDDQILDGIVDKEIEYRENGAYVPNFDNSEELTTIKSSNAVENTDGYKCSQHVVVPEGGQCTDFTYRSDIHYIRMKDLISNNPTVDCDNLVVGTKLCIASNEEDTTDYSEYITEEGDTLESIAQKLAVDPTVLKNINQPIFDYDVPMDAGIEIRYYMNGVYVPDFSNSEDITNKFLYSFESSDGYKCDQHVVVPEGGQCTDFTYRADINYVRMKDLTSYNPSIDCDNLVAGTKLCIEPNDDTFFSKYITEEGDTLQSIAEKLDADPTVLKNLNQPIFDYDEPMDAGVEIKYSMNGVYVPDFSNSEDITDKFSNPSESSNGYKCDQHVVVPEGGQCTDFTYRADINYVRIKDLTSYNPAIDCDNLVAGTKLCIEPNDDTFFSKYITEEGDTLQSIAQKLDTDPTVLKNLNQPIFDYDEPMDAGVEIKYSMNGVYVPNFSNSEDITVKFLYSFESFEGYKCDQHVVVREGAECTDYTHRTDINYIRLVDLTSYNPAIDCDNLVAGIKLCIDPNDDGFKTFFSKYITEEGDTLESIAEKLAVDPTVLKNLNQPIFDFETPKKAGIEIRYSVNGVYVPDFSDSEEVYA